MLKIEPPDSIEMQTLMEMKLNNVSKDIIISLVVIACVLIIAVIAVPPT